MVTSLMRWRFPWHPPVPPPQPIASITLDEAKETEHDEQVRERLKRLEEIEVKIAHDLAEMTMPRNHAP